jgi:hypothetical protein
MMYVADGAENIWVAHKKLENAAKHQAREGK